MEHSGARRERQREMFVFVRVGTSKGIDTNPLKLTLFATSFFLCINILNGGVEKKIKYVSQRVHEIFF